MITRFGKRSVAFLMALIMVFSLVPVQAFATETGEDHEHCEVCGQHECICAPDEGIAPVAEHICDFVAGEAVAPTCGAEGYTPYTCAGCGAAENRDQVPATGAHTDVAGEPVAATAESQGYTPYTCSVCGRVENRDFVDYVAPVEPEQPEVTEPEATEPVETEPEEGPSALALDLTARVNAIVADYGITAGMADNEIANQIFPKNGDQIKATMDEIEAIDAEEANVTETDIGYITSNAQLDEYNQFMSVFNQLMNPMLLATSADVLDGKVSVNCTSASEVSASGNTVTIKGKGSLFSNKTHSITINNNTTDKAQLEFGYKLSNSNGFQIGSSSISETEGLYSGVIEPSGSLTLKLTVWGTTTTGTVTLSNFTLTPIVESANVTFQFDSALGSITVDGTAVADGNTVTVSGSTGAALVATANPGTAFLGWMDTANNKLISGATSHNLIPTGDATVKAVFATTTPWFFVDKGQYLFDDLNVAATAAASATNKAFVLANNATLPAGEYTIPAGVTLLIPFDAAGTLYTTEPGRPGTDDYTRPSAFRTLTMADGAHITVNGALSVSGKQSASQNYAGHPTGDLGFINMQSGSTITAKSGAFLYVWGYIIGSGSVVAESGATVYEDFQLLDFRGGDGTSNMVDNKNGVFPMSQFYLQNIEVPLTIYAGAKEYANMSAYVAYGQRPATLPVVSASGGDAMFQIASGYIIKDYVEGTGRIKFTANGNFSISPIKMSMQLSVLGTKTIDSTNFNLPIPGHFTVDVQSGTVTIKQSVALLPGAQLYIREGVTGSLVENKRIVVYDVDDWGGYCNDTNKRWMALSYVPGGEGTEGRETDAMVQVDGTIDASRGAVYTTAGGANIISTGSGKVISSVGVDTVTYQATQKLVNDNQEITYVPIDVTPAKLKNADGSYFETSQFPVGEAINIKYENGAWRQFCDGTNHILGDSEEYKAATCTEDGYRKGTCVDCGYVEEIYAATGHTEVADAAVASTCTETGLTAGSHCSVCNAVIVAQETVDAQGHDWNTTGTRTTEPTCTEEGVMTYSCKRDSSHTYTAAIPARNHDQDFNRVTVAPTCTEQGYTLETCKYTDCNYENKTNYTDAKGHVWGTVTYKRSEDNTTWTASRTCRSGEPLEHTETETVAVNTTEVVATCMTPGYITYAADFTVDWAVDQSESTDPKENPDNHEKLEIAAAVAPTCTKDGKTEGRSCAACDHTVVEPTTVAALGHAWGDPTYTWTTDKSACTASRTCERGCQETLPATVASKVTQEANCQQIGITTYTATFTENWAASQTETVEVEKNLDNHANILEFDSIDPTCTEPGYEGGKKCTACGTVIEGGNQNAKPRGHNYVSVVTAPTCTEKGYTTKTCNRCDYSEVVGYVEAKGHTSGSAVVENNVDPDCINSGSYDSVVYCTVETCKAQISRETITVDALGHEDEAIPAKDPTCTETGLTAGVKCSVCDTVITAQEEVDALGHDIVIDEAVAPTCTETGLTEGSHCSRCDGATVAQEIVKVLGHSYNEGEVTIPATCETAGEKTLTCQNDGCNNIITQPIVALGHDLENHDAKAPTCTEIGWYAYKTCKREDCDYTTYSERAALGHAEDTKSKKENVVDSTCTEPGSYDNVYYCWRCGTEEMRRVPVTVDALGHDVEYHKGKAATCTEAGYEAYETCSRCDHTTYKTIEATGHSYGAVVTEPTCTADGYTTYTCSVCKDSYTGDTVATSGHSYEAVVTAPTCTAAGYTIHTCSVCQDSYIDGEVAALSHDYEAVVTKDATCTELGVKTYTCKNDETHTYTEDIPATNHEGTTVTIEGKEATCTEDGLTDGKKCTACDKILEEQEVIEATGHTYENGVCHCGDIEGVTVSGTVTSFNSNTDEVTVELYAEGEETAAYTATVTGNTATYSIEKVKAGTYTMKVSKKNHVTREYAVTVEKEAVSQDVKICLIGDVDGNGMVMLLDYALVLRHVQKIELITDKYAQACADVDGNNLILLLDYAKILRHVQKIELLF